MALVQKRSEFQSFLQSRSSPSTSEAYEGHIKRIAPDPDAFVDLARRDRVAATRIIVDFIAVRKRQVKAVTLGNDVSALLSFCSYCEVGLPSKRIMSEVPKQNHVSDDRAPLMEEKRAMYEVAGPRERLLLLMLNSLGGRRGAFWFPVVEYERRGKRWDWMALKHVTFMDCGCASVVVYPGEVEEYVTFLTPEAVKQLNLTLDLRRGVGEKITPDSPVMRDAWSMEGGYGYLNANRGEPLKDKSVSTLMRRLRVKAGIRSTSRDGGFKVTHGFRKDYKNAVPSCERHGDLDKEMLLGHRGHYDKQTLAHLHEQFHRAIPALTLSEAVSLKAELATREEEHREAWTENRLETLELKERVRELEGLVRSNLEAFRKIREVRLGELKKERDSLSRDP